MEIKDVANLRIGDKGYNGDTEGAYVVTKLGEGWIGTTHPVTGRLAVSHEEAAGQDWRWFRDAEINPRSIAKALNGIIDDAVSDGATSTFLEGADYSEDEVAFVREVGKSVSTSANGLSSQFTIETGDGRKWTVRVTPGIN